MQAPGPVRAPSPPARPAEARAARWAYTAAHGHTGVPSAAAQSSYTLRTRRCVTHARTVAARDPPAGAQHGRCLGPHNSAAGAHRHSSASGLSPQYLSSGSPLPSCSSGSAPSALARYANPRRGSRPGPRGGAHRGDLLVGGRGGHLLNLENARQRSALQHLAPVQAVLDHINPLSHGWRPGPHRVPSCRTLAGGAVGAGVLGLLDRRLDGAAVLRPADAKRVGTHTLPGFLHHAWHALHALAGSILLPAPARAGATAEDLAEPAPRAPAQHRPVLRLGHRNCAPRPRRGAQPCLARAASGCEGAPPPHCMQPGACLPPPTGACFLSTSCLFWPANGPVRPRPAPWWGLPARAS